MPIIHPFHPASPAEFTAPAPKTGHAGADASPGASGEPTLGLSELVQPLPAPAPRVWCPDLGVVGHHLVWEASTGRYRPIGPAILAAARDLKEAPHGSGFFALRKSRLPAGLFGAHDALEIRFVARAIHAARKPLVRLTAQSDTTLFQHSFDCPGVLEAHCRFCNQGSLYGQSTRTICVGAPATPPTPLGLDLARHPIELTLGVQLNLPADTVVLEDWEVIWHPARG